MSVKFESRQTATPSRQNTPPDCTDNKIIVEVTLTDVGSEHYELTGGRIEVPATITPYDGEWRDGKQEYKAFFVELNYDTTERDGYPSIGKPVLKYLDLTGYLFDSEGKQNRHDTNTRIWF